MPVVVDASVVIAALLRDGYTRERIMAPTAGPFVAPEAMVREVRSHLGRLAVRANVEEAALVAVLEGLLRRIQLVSDLALETTRPAALEATSAAEAWNDEAYVALAMLLDAPIWSYDPDFQRVKGIRLVGPPGLGP